MTGRVALSIINRSSEMKEPPRITHHITSTELTSMRATPPPGTFFQIHFLLRTLILISTRSELVSCRPRLPGVTNRPMCLGQGAVVPPFVTGGRLKDLVGKYAETHNTFFSDGWCPETGANTPARNERTTTSHPTGRPT